MEQMNQADEIDLREVFAVLRRHIWLIIVIPLIAALTAGALSIYVLRPVYSASTTLWVIKQEAATIDYNTLLMNRNLVKTYAEVAKSRAVMEEVINSENLSDLNVPALQGKLSVQPVKDTEIIELAVTDGDPARAAQIANAVAAAFMDQLGNFIKLENVAVVDRATVPTSPVKPRPILNTAIAGVLGLMAAFGLAFLREYMDTTIRTVDDAERALGLATLAVVPFVDLHRDKLIAGPRKAGIKRRADDQPARRPGDAGEDEGAEQIAGARASRHALREVAAANSDDGEVPLPQ